MNEFERTTQISISIEDQPDPAQRSAVLDGLIAYNRQHVPDDHYQRLTIFLREEDRVIGGLLGETYWGWLHISILWIEEGYRRQGYGEQLLAEAEAEALRRGCPRVHLDTLSFQALPFYERNGYTVFGVLPDHPEGHTRYFLQKRLNVE
jgi:GNAT superfamily N-acetyltransferase